jgi:hypothetical protein
VKLIGLKITLLAVFINTAILYAQNVSIEISELSIVDKHLEINYDFIKAKKNHRFEVWIDVSNSNGDKLSARTFTGDIGANLNGLGGKKIVWDYNADGLVINDEIEVFINAKQSTVASRISGGKSILQSLLMPGLGMSYIDKGKPYWLIGFVGYGTLATSIYLNSSSKNNYNKYLNTIDIEESTKYFDKSQSQKDLSRAFTIAAIGTWSFSLIWTVIKTNQHNKALTSNFKENKLKLYSNIDPLSKKPLLGVQYNF